MKLFVIMALLAVSFSAFASCKKNYRPGDEDRYPIRGTGPWVSGQCVSVDQTYCDSYGALYCTNAAPIPPTYREDEEQDMGTCSFLDNPNCVRIDSQTAVCAGRTISLRGCN